MPSRSTKKQLPATSGTTRQGGRRGELCAAASTKEENKMKRRLGPLGAMGAALAALAAGSGPAVAQEYPVKAIRMVVGFPPGGSNDIVARQLAPRVGDALGQQVVVENRPGANATIATEYVARSTPDGYTILIGSVSSLALSPHTFSKLGYDVQRDFAPVTTVAMTPELIAVHPSLPVKNLPELIALAKQQPGKLTFASSGNGGLPHLAIERMKALAQINVLHVAYKGAGPAANDVVGGHVTGIIMDFPAIFGQVKAGRMRALGLAAEQRIALMPDLPTAGEQGLKGLLAVNWFAIMAPAKTPRPAVDKLHAAFVKAVQAPDMQERLRAMGIEPMASASPEAAAKFLQSESQRWGKVVKESGARAD
jgi:tripartite-type tricarboxylate transporter receptor subunit TctC